MSLSGAAGRRPGAKRPRTSRPQRVRPIRPAARSHSDEDQERQQTAYTARAAVLVLAIAAVIVAVAVPAKIWLGQRSDLSTLAAQTERTELRVAQLKAQDKQWQQPSFIATQARNRLHYVMPGQKTYVVLGRTRHQRALAAQRKTAVAAGPWYSQFWQSVETAGKAPDTK